MCFAVGNITICGFRKIFKYYFTWKNVCLPAKPYEFCPPTYGKKLKIIIICGETDYMRFIEKGLTLFSSIKIIFTKKIEYLKHYSWNTGIGTDIKKNAFVYYSINSRRPCC